MEEKKFKFEDVFGVAHHVDDLPEFDDDRLLADSIVKIFERGVADLGNPEVLPIPEINEMMKLFWNLVGNRITPTAIAGVETMGVAVECNGGRAVAVVMIPHDWPEQVAKDPYMQLGALVYNASKARDYWNFKIPETGPEGMDESHYRAMMFETEFLYHLERTFRDFEPNEYQRKIMELYPQGIKAGPSIMYDGMPYQPAPFLTALGDLELRKPVPFARPKSK